LCSFLFSLLLRLPPIFTFFPYTTLFRSGQQHVGARARIDAAESDRLFHPVVRPVTVRGNTLDVEVEADLGAGLLHQLRHLLGARSEEHTSELQSRGHLVCRLLLEKKKRD